MSAPKRKPSSPGSKSPRAKRLKVGQDEIKALWALSEHVIATDEQNGILRATACLEAVLQVENHTRILPRTELETRLRLGDLLSRGSDTLVRARQHLERAVLPPNTLHSSPTATDRVDLHSLNEACDSCVAVETWTCRWS